MKNWEKIGGVQRIVALHLMSDEADMMEIENSLKMFENVQADKNLYHNI